MSKSWLLSLSIMAILSWHSIALAQTEPLEVVASFSILADVVAQVGGTHASVTSLIPVGTDPHSFEPTPRSLTMLASADLVFTNGLNFEENLLPVIANATAAPIVEASRCVVVRQLGINTAEQDEPEAEHDHNEAHDEACEDIHAQLATLTTSPQAHEEEMMAYACEVEEEAEHEGEEHDHDHAGCDPHVWQNPYNVMVWTLAVRDALTTLDPAHADAYADNAQTYLAELNVLVTDFILPTLESLTIEQRLLVTNHETMGYFAQAFEFRMLATVLEGNTTGGESSLQDLVVLVDELKQTGVVALFAETSVGDGVIQQVAQEINVPVFTLYTDSLSEPNGVAPTYLAYMRYNVGTIAEALTQTTP